MQEATTSPSDAVLAQQARDGDRGAFNTLCDRHLPSVYNRLRALLPPEAVDDVTQEVFVAATRAIHRYRAQASFRTWLSAIARHKVADYYRSRERNPATVALDAVTDRATAHVTWEERTLDRALVREVLLSLPDHYREVLLLRFAEGLKFKDVATALGISLEAAKSRYRRAVAAAAVALGEDG
jgi:RNA polymerase sigma-70 factor (ECF subfamily)